MDSEELNIGLLLRFPYRALEDRIFAALARAGFDITPAQARLFRRVAPEGSRVTDLAERARVTKQTASVLVQGLVDAGYAERFPDPKDARASLVRASALGLQAAAVVDAEIARVEAEWSRAIGPTRYARLRRDLGELVRHLQG
ncbi:MarR family winged helix-turn-helix transcriptional regulator [Sinomonas gamaensis]|uniref:MarR family winged helix-turn-helix transcriptional regulator n=1 Tax=Sinomonas gamaensis TaxID=2565624 RepID=UPI001486F331|nr:MarR family transcriptional regulator [Sinomonas gamaensis]